MSFVRYSPPQKKQIRRSLQTRCKRDALMRRRDILAQVQGLFTQAFQGSRPSVELLSGAWEASGVGCVGCVSSSCLALLWPL